MANNLVLGITLKAFDQLTGPVTKASKSVGDLLKEVKKSSTGKLQLAADLNQVAQTASRMSDGIMNFMKGPIDEALSFQKAMNNVKAQLGGATQQEIQAISDKAAELGEKTVFSSTTAAEAFAQMGQSGFTAAQTLVVVEPVMNLASAGALEMARAAEISADMMGSFSMKAEDMTRITDVLALTASSSSSSVEGIYEAMKMVGPGAVKLGLDIEQTAAMIGVLANSGLKGSIAGTGLRGVLASISAPSNDAAKAFKKLGVEFAENGKIRPLNAVLSDLQKKLAGLGTAEQAKALDRIFGREAGTAAQVLIKSAGKDLDEYTGKIKKADGSAKEMADTMNSGAVGAFESLSGSVAEVKRVIGDELLKVLKPLSEMAIDLASDIGKWIKQNAALVRVLAVGALVVAGLAAVLAGLATMVAALIAGWVAWGAISAIVIGAFSTVGAFVALITVGIIALISAGWQLYSNWTLIKDFLLDMWSSISDAVIQGTVGVWNSTIAPWIDHALAAIAKIGGALGFESVEKLKNISASIDINKTTKDIAGRTKDIAGGGAASVNGKVDINVTSDGKAKVTNVEKGGPVDLNVNAGLATGI